MWASIPQLRKKLWQPWYLHGEIDDLILVLLLQGCEQVVGCVGPRPLAIGSIPLTCKPYAHKMLLN